MPRFKLRTLMIAVAVVALLCSIVTILADSYIGLYLIIILVGPIIGACWAGFRAKEPLLGCVIGGMMGALVETLILFMVSLYFFPKWPSLDDVGYMIFYCGVFLAASAFAGAFVGFLIGFVLFVTSELRQRRLGQPSVFD